MRNHINIGMYTIMSMSYTFFLLYVTYLAVQEVEEECVFVVWKQVLKN